MLTSPQDFATNVSDTAALEKVTNLQDTVRQLLEKFNEELSIEVAKREALSKQATEIQYGLKNVKGRTGALEAKFKTMSEDIDELEVTVQGIRNENGFMAATTNTSDAGLATYVYDRIDKLEAGVTGIDKLQASINSLRADVEMHRVVLNDMGQKHEAGWVNGGNQNGWGGSRDDDDSDWAVAAAANNENGWANASSSDGGRTVGKSEMPDAQLLMKVVSSLFRDKSRSRHVANNVSCLDEDGEGDESLQGSQGDESPDRQLFNSRYAVRDVSAPHQRDGRCHG